jgi:hypothetical protein
MAFISFEVQWNRIVRLHPWATITGLDDLPKPEMWELDTRVVYPEDDLVETSRVERETPIVHRGLPRTSSKR